MKRRLEYLKDWNSTYITDITRAMVSERHASITAGPGGTTANIVMRYLSAVLNWASLHYAPSDDDVLLSSNPVSILKAKRQWNSSQRRQTFIPSAELPVLWTALHSLPEKAERWGDQAEVARDYFQFCLFTGMRPGEAIRLQLDMVDIARRFFVLQDSKNRSDFHLPFSTEVEKILVRRIRHAIDIENEFVFPSFGHHGKSPTVSLRHSTAEISKVVPGFVPNDMRRTFTTIINNMEPAISHLTLKRLLNHAAVDVDSNDVTAGYFATDVERQRPVVERVAKEILRRCGQINACDSTEPAPSLLPWPEHRW